MSEVTKADLWDVRDRLTELIEVGFQRTHARQDVTNGRLLKAESELTRHDERIKTLFRRQAKPEDEGDDRRITQREVLIALGTIVATVAVLKFLPMLATLVKP